jgi:hypothetical protein
MKKTIKSSMKKYQKGGTTQKKAPQDFISQANRFIDDWFRTSVNKSVASTNKKIQKKLDPVRKDVANTNKKIQKSLDPVRKKAAEVNTQTQKLLDSVRGAVYNKPSTKTTKGTTPTKSSTTSGKVEIAKPKAGSVTTYDGSVKLVGSGKVVKPATKKTTPAPTAKPGTGKTSPKPTTKPATGKTTPKPTVKPTPKPTAKTPTKPTTSAKTVSQLWTEKTGTPWSEAKKQGMSDGTAASNMALMKKLQSGSPMEYTRAYTGPDYSADAAAEAAFGEPKTTMRRGGSVKKKMKSKKK